ncbi:DNA packaging tegument protein UL25 [Beluga whale alphaherpesvirus 1]|uniref:DNA packaging tegument protein UL25 n=1 Tax=Beluga whale alphaherpesvirus 1 TaxID=1434720 RepID=A0A286MM56_9ALPH|nr:DNA packaging tegument protein UL25 [Beluga whale alphaherpesvirus 1]ASW27082.1 DNA packaging tegument protein UL25 [Beluga whale alphaherpesvirus 1]
MHPGVRFVFPSVGAGGAFPPDARNFIAPAFPQALWSAPRSSAPPDALEQLAVAQARNRAAAAATDDLIAHYAAVPDGVDRRLRPLEAQLSRIARVLGDLEGAAEAAEAVDASAGAGGADRGPGAEEEPPERGAAREVQIVKNDAVLEYDTNLPTDFLAMVYAARAAGGSSGVVFGPWYRTLQDQLVADHPLATRSVDYRDGRMSRTFMTTAVAALQSCGRLYVGARPYTALECAVLCLHLAHRRTVDGFQYPATFGGLVRQIPAYLDALAPEVEARAGAGAAYAYAYDRLPRQHFQAPGGGRYDRGALGGHAVVAALLALKVLPAIPGTLGSAAGPDPEIDGAAGAYVDEVNRAAGAYFARAQNLFLTEDQTLLRAAVNTITALLLLRRLLWNGNVYSDRLKNSFQLGLLVPAAADAAATPRGADGPGAACGLKSAGNNLAFLCAHYVARLYEENPGAEVTQLFPGLVALALDATADRAAASGRRVVRVAADRQQAGLVRLVALELENRQRVAGAPIAEVIGAHDAVLMQFERGLGLLMRRARLRAALAETRQLRQFNVSSDYDLLYFLCLGYVPLYTAAV